MDIICVRTENVQAAYTPVHLYVFYEWGLHKMLRPENVHPLYVLELPLKLSQYQRTPVRTPV